MSAQGIRVESERVAVTASVEHSGAHPVVTLSVDTYHTGPTRVRIEEHLPDGFSTDDVAFHPDYHADCWDVKGDRLVFERDVDWGESIETAFAVDASDPDECLPFLRAPAVEMLEPDGGVLDGIDRDEFSAAAADLGRRLHRPAGAPVDAGASGGGTPLSGSPDDDPGTDRDASGTESPRNEPDESPPETLEELFGTDGDRGG